MDTATEAARAFGRAAAAIFFGNATASVWSAARGARLMLRALLSRRSTRLRIAANREAFRVVRHMADNLKLSFSLGRAKALLGLCSMEEWMKAQEDAYRATPFHVEHEGEDWTALRIARSVRGLSWPPVAVCNAFMREHTDEDARFSLDEVSTEPRTYKAALVLCVVIAALRNFPPVEANA